MTTAVARILDDLRQRGGLKGIDVANMTAVSPATVSRWTSGSASPHPKTQRLIYDQRYVVERLAAQLGVGRGAGDFGKQLVRQERRGARG